MSGSLPQVAAEPRAASSRASSQGPQPRGRRPLCKAGPGQPPTEEGLAQRRRPPLPLSRAQSSLRHARCPPFPRWALGPVNDCGTQGPAAAVNPRACQGAASLRAQPGGAPPREARRVPSLGHFTGGKRASLGNLGSASVSGDPNAGLWRERGVRACLSCVCRTKGRLLGAGGSLLERRDVK